MRQATPSRRGHRRFAKGIGLETTEFGAITFVQRFGSSLNLNVHLHVAVVEGVFSRDAQSRLRFTPAPPPTTSEMLAIARAVRKRVTKLLGRHDVPEDEQRSALDHCGQIALFRGDVRKLGESNDPLDDEPPPPVRGDGSRRGERYNIEASVRIDGDDDFGREHLLRYCARPPLAPGRLSMLAKPRKSPPAEDCDSPPRKQPTALVERGRTFLAELVEERAQRVGAATRSAHTTSRSLSTIVM